MKVVNIHGPGDVRVDERDKPHPGADDILIKVAACGICGSDLTYARLGGVAGPAGLMALGHELSGVVHSVGERVRSFSSGDRVVVNPYNNMIGNGGPEGGFAEYLLVRNAAVEGSSVHAIPDSLSFEHAALAEPLAVALHAVNRAETRPGQRVAVFGAGPIGLGVVVGLVRRGIKDIVAIDYSQFRLERARTLGATTTVNAGERNVRQVLQEVHGHGTHFGMEVVNTDVFIDVAGAPSVIPSVIEMCRLGARLVVTAVYSRPIAIDFRMVLAKELTIAAALGYPSEYPEIIEMLSSMGTNVEPMISHRIALKEFQRAFESARNAGAAAKVMITFL